MLQLIVCAQQRRYASQPTAKITQYWWNRQAATVSPQGRALQPGPAPAWRTPDSALSAPVSHPAQTAHCWGPIADWHLHTHGSHMTGCMHVHEVISHMSLLFALAPSQYGPYKLRLSVTSVFSHTYMHWNTTTCTHTQQDGDSAWLHHTLTCYKSFKAGMRMVVVTSWHLLGRMTTWYCRCYKVMLKKKTIQTTSSSRSSRQLGELKIGLRMVVPQWERGAPCAAVLCWQGDRL